MGRKMENGSSPACMSCDRLLSATEQQITSSCILFIQVDRQPSFVCAQIEFKWIKNLQRFFFSFESWRGISVAIGIHFWCCNKSAACFLHWTVWLTLIATSVLQPADYYHNSRRPRCGQSNYPSSAPFACYWLFAGLNAPTNGTRLNTQQLAIEKIRQVE